MYRNKNSVLGLLCLIAIFVFSGCFDRNDKTQAVERNESYESFEYTISDEETMDSPQATVPIELTTQTETIEPTLTIEPTETMQTIVNPDPTEVLFATESTEPLQEEILTSDQHDVSASESLPENAQEKILPFGQLTDPQITDFVNVTWYIPDIYIELKYAGNDNFTQETIYNFQDAYLRYGTVLKLMNVCEELEHYGLYLKIWDAFRPASAQFVLWDTYPDPNFVANPNRGFSAHTRGNTLDVTLVDGQGNELLMPSEFDDFSSAADRDFTDCSEDARQNVQILQSVMEQNGFKGYWGEWWHFTDQYQYDVEKVFDPGEISTWYPKCNEYITLRKRASGYSDPLGLIYLGKPITVLGYTGQFALVEFNGQRGYVLKNYIRETP